MEVLCDGNILALIISGVPTADDLVNAWENIITEYTESVGSSEQKIFVSTLRQVMLTKITLEQIEKLIAILKDRYAKPLADMLNRLLSSDFELNPDDPEQYDNDLKRAYSKSRGLKMSLDLKEIELAGLQSKLTAHDGQRPNREYFTNALISLSDHAGFHLTDQIMTAEFCTRIRRYTKFIESQNSRNNGPGR